MESRLNIAVVTPQTGQDFQEPLCCIHNNVLVKNRPPDLKHGDKIVIDKKIIGQRRRVTPVPWPVLQPEVADCNGRIQRLLWCEWSALKRTTRHDRVPQIGEFLASSG